MHMQCRSGITYFAYVKESEKLTSYGSERGIKSLQSGCFLGIP